MAYPENKGPQTTGLAQAKARTLALIVEPETEMTEKARKEVMADYAEMVRRRDSHLAGAMAAPRPTSLEVHVDAATWEEWIDGNLSDEYIEEQIRNHSNNCNQCQSTYERYKELKKKSR